MKKIILFLLISFNGFSQIKYPDTDFNLFEQKVYWEHIYNIPGKNVDELINYFQKEVTQSLSKKNLQIIDNTLSFTVNNDFVDFKKYGGSIFGTPTFLRFPMSYIVVVDFKNEKYKIMIKEINISDPSRSSSNDITEYFTQKNKSEFKTTSVIKNSITYYHKYFSDKFIITNTPTNKDW
jgi:hypothetical protein